MCLRYMRSFFAPLHSGINIRSSYWLPILHYTFITNIHLSTTQLKGNTHFHSAGYIHSVFPQALSHTFPMVFFIFCVELTPKTATIFPHRPLAVAVSQAIELILHVLAVGAFISASFRAGCRLVPHPQPDTAFHLHFFASTSAPRSISIPFLTPYIPFPQSYTCHFPTHFQRLLSFLRRVYPKRTEYFVF